jgi:type I restriction enzyme M protein
MIDMLDPKEGETIYDPACGTGGMLLAAVQHVNEQHGDVKRLWGKLFGQEKNLTTSSIARMNLFLHGIEDFQIVRGDTLRNPAFFDGDRLATFDCVIANPPFSLEKWGEESWLNDPFGRNFAGLPPSGSGDFAWVQHMVKSMAEGTGRMAVVLPQGALFRKGAEGSIRQKLLELDLIEAVIGLAPNLFYGTGLAACILVLRKKKPADRRNKVMIADASRLFRRGRAQNFLEPEHARTIHAWYESHEAVQDAVRIVERDEIEAEDWTLNISRYILPPLTEDIPPLPEAIAAFKEALCRCREAEERLAKVMAEGGWLQ